MATENLPSLDNLSSLLITSDDLGKSKEAEFVRGIKNDKVKMLVSDNQISCVMLAPEVYNALREAAERVVKASAAQ